MSEEEGIVIMWEGNAPSMLIDHLEAELPTDGELAVYFVDHYMDNGNDDKAAMVVCDEGHVHVTIGVDTSIRTYQLSLVIAYSMLYYRLGGVPLVEVCKRMARTLRCFSDHMAELFIGVGVTILKDWHDQHPSDPGKTQLRLDPIRTLRTNKAEMQQEEPEAKGRESRSWTKYSPEPDFDVDRAQVVPLFGHRFKGEA